MTEVKLPKYKVIRALNAEELEAKINALAEVGYILKDVVLYPSDLTTMHVIMALGENDYSDVIQIKDVSPELADEAIRGGLEPVSMSLSTKFIRMVRRKKL